jgi:hypothetical protein
MAELSLLCTSGRLSVWYRTDYPSLTISIDAISMFPHTSCLVVLKRHTASVQTISVTDFVSMLQ